MSRSGLDVLDKTLQTTNIWLDELMQEIGPDRQVAWHVLGVVLRAVRDRIPVGLAVHLGSQLPILVRGTYYDQWHAPGETLENPARSLDEFLQPINEQLSNIRPVNVRDATRAVFGILSRHLSRGQIDKVRKAMPEQVRNLWEDSPKARDVSARTERTDRDDGREKKPGNQRQARSRAQPTRRKPAKKRARTLSKAPAKRRPVAKRSKAARPARSPAGAKTPRQTRAAGLSKTRRKSKRAQRNKDLLEWLFGE